MPLVEPFKGLRYNPAKAKPLSHLVTPPYDVISPKEQSEFYRRHPQNFIRVVYGRKQPGDTPEHNPYSRAKASLEQWVNRDILQRDEELSVYPYEQEYRLKGKVHRRLGVIALVHLGSRVYPHEKIYSGPKLDRLQLTRTLGVSLDPIFGLIPDARGSYRRFVSGVCRVRKPVASFAFGSVRHRLWRITDPGWIRNLRAILRSRELVIADGHHRFEAARAYREERRRKDPQRDSRAAYNFVMFYLSAAGAEEPGLLPTHRLVQAPASRLKGMLDRMKKQKLAESVGSRRTLLKKLELLRAKGRVGVGLYTGNGSGYLLRPAAGNRFPLGVEWLQRTILGGSLDHPPVSYTQDLSAAYDQVRRGQAQAVFVVQPPRLREVLERARASRRMPRKTTYFYPKLLSGLVEYPLKG